MKVSSRSWVIYLELISDIPCPLVLHLTLLQLCLGLLRHKLDPGQLVPGGGGQRLTQLCQLSPGAGVQLPYLRGHNLNVLSQLLKLFNYKFISISSVVLYVIILDVLLSRQYWRKEWSVA